MEFFSKESHTAFSMLLMTIPQSLVAFPKPEPPLALGICVWAPLGLANSGVGPFTFQWMPAEGAHSVCLALKPPRKLTPDRTENRETSVQPQAENLHTGKLVPKSLEPTVPAHLCSVLRSAKSHFILWEVIVPRKATGKGREQEEGSR